MKEKRRIKLNRGLCAITVLLLILTMIPSFVPSTLAATNSIQQVIKVSQTVEGKPEKTEYVYAVIQTYGPDMTGKISNRSFVLSNNDSFETYMTFSEPGTYEFTVGRIKNEAKSITEITLDDLYKDDNVVPVNHPFGYKVTENEDGTLNVLPYTCYDNHVEFLKDGTGIVLTNLIKGPVEPTPTPTPSATVTPTPSATVTPTPSPKPSSYSGNTDNGKGQYTPKTGDEFRMALWISIAGVSILGIIILLILGRKKKKDKEET